MPAFESVAAHYVAPVDKSTQELPTDVNPPDGGIIFYEQIQFERYQLTGDANDLTVDLHKRKRGDIGEDMTVYFHVGILGEDSDYQSRREPANWKRPISSWLKDEIIYDQPIIKHITPLDGSDNQISIGFYYSDNPNSRLGATDNGQNIPEDPCPLSSSPDSAE